jgi:hypothetical protein
MLAALLFVPSSIQHHQSTSTMPVAPYDAFVVVGSQTFPVHRVILASRSQYFAALFHHYAQQQQQQQQQHEQHEPITLTLTAPTLDCDTFARYLACVNDMSSLSCDSDDFHRMLPMVAMFRDAPLLLHMASNLPKDLTIARAVNLTRVCNRLGLPSMCDSLWRFVAFQCKFRPLSAKSFVLDGEQPTQDEQCNVGAKNEHVSALTQRELLELIRHWE